MAGVQPSKRTVTEKRRVVYCELFAKRSMPNRRFFFIRGIYGKNEGMSGLNCSGAGRLQPKKARNRFSFYYNGLHVILFAAIEVFENAFSNIYSISKLFFEVIFLFGDRWLCELFSMY